MELVWEVESKGNANAITHTKKHTQRKNTNKHTHRHTWDPHTHTHTVYIMQ